MKDQNRKDVNKTIKDKKAEVELLKAKIALLRN